MKGRESRIKKVRTEDFLNPEVLAVIAKALGTSDDQITDMHMLKKGMTNRSFVFRCHSRKYIIRIPGEGTGQLIHRGEEAQVYHAIADKELCDDVVYINPENGYKITAFIENARVCDPFCPEDLEKCMNVLRRFHSMKLRVEHEFDIFGQIRFYEALRGAVPSVYADYESTRQKVFSLQNYIDRHAGEKYLTHIDAVPDNFLFGTDREGKEVVRLIDWEYAGMQDTDVDIAMFCLYSLYDKDQTDGLIDIYYNNGCPERTRTKIYCYMSACGLLWSNWCEYKSGLGVEFGEYSQRQYRYARDYYNFARERIQEDDT